MAKIQNSPKQGRGIPDGDYTITVDSHKFSMRLITRDNDEPTKSGLYKSRILMVISSSKWFKKTGRRWCGFAFYDVKYCRLHVWIKFAGTKKRGRDWDKLAEAFYEQVLVPYMSHEHETAGKMVKDIAYAQDDMNIVDNFNIHRKESW